MTLRVVGLAVVLVALSFASEAVAGTYRFRLKVVRQAGLPFRSGVSPVVRVSVTP